MRGIGGGREEEIGCSGHNAAQKTNSGSLSATNCANSLILGVPFACFFLQQLYGGIWDYRKSHVRSVKFGQS